MLLKSALLVLAVAVEGDCGSTSTDAVRRDKGVKKKSGAGNRI